eukprot:CAMPEP_0176338788 /NCGR_PEP_ID=MMETSP0126-20121128/231_1 /TAXON_ID=141414 ORGANISM="Strombidinopsis acuminatum, Strain SPMC142" /NCGR_SAMPLE_ID=MMETSP0126 /ASSEMBLY_ACC=CAM_ASM_000229 /LENGTH=53 /DNA_ID=CAMNT_0017681961 /DNA_START=383 /DNA_END=544 /DNA_ORIENTATION=-
MAQHCDCPSILDQLAMTRASKPPIMPKMATSLPKACLFVSMQPKMLPPMTDKK